MKLCKDCKWWKEAQRESDDLCTHPNSNWGYVRGIRFQTCINMRGFPCEPEAKLWEPRYEQSQESVSGATGTSSLATT
jgi:hypothetical protein